VTDDGTAQDSAPAADESQASKDPCEEGLKRAAKEAAKARKKEDGAISKVMQDTNNVQIEQQVARPRKGANYKIGLQNTVQGIVTRFPPRAFGISAYRPCESCFIERLFWHMRNTTAACFSASMIRTQEREKGGIPKCHHRRSHINRNPD